MLTELSAYICTMKTTIDWADFEKVQMAVGTVVRANEFPEARRPALKLVIDFGEELGMRNSSAQITDVYKPGDLIGMQIIAVVNFPAKQIGPMMSECLVLGVVGDRNGVVLLTPERPVSNGLRIS